MKKNLEKNIKLRIEKKNIIFFEEFVFKFSHFLNIQNYVFNEFSIILPLKAKIDNLRSFFSLEYEKMKG